MRRLLSYSTNVGPLAPSAILGNSMAAFHRRGRRGGNKETPTTSVSQPQAALSIEVNKYYRNHKNRPMRALYEALKDAANPSIELPMAIVMDQRCGIERATDVADRLRVNPHGVNMLSATPLMMAIYVGRIDVAKALIAAGANPSAASNGGKTPLHIAAEYGNVRAIEVLVKLGANLEAVDKSGQTPLYYPVLYLECQECIVASNIVKAIKALVKLGANLEAVDNLNKTPLHIAVQYGDVSTIEVLVRLGANLEAVDRFGQTPLHIAASLGRDRAIRALRGSAALESALAAVDAEGQTPLNLYMATSVPLNDKIRALLTPK